MKYEYEEKIENDESLKSLLVDKQVGLFSNFSKGEYDENFKTYIQIKYYGAFTEIYKKYIDTKEQTVITSLLRSVDHLATKETKDKIVVDLQDTLEKAAKSIRVVKDALPDDGSIFVNVSLVGTALSYVAVNIFNTFDEYQSVQDYKKVILEDALDVCDELSTASIKNDPIKFALYDGILGRLKKVVHFGSLKERFDRHNKKASKKKAGFEIRNWIWIIVVVLLFLFRLLSRLG